MTCFDILRRRHGGSRHGLVRRIVCGGGARRTDWYRQRRIPIRTSRALRRSCATPKPPHEKGTIRLCARQGSRLHPKAHHLILQVNTNDPAAMNLALNNATNVAQYYKDLGEKVKIEVVTFGPGLHMLRDDTSPVKARIKAMC